MPNNYFSSIVTNWFSCNFNGVSIKNLCLCVIFGCNFCRIIQQKTGTANNQLNENKIYECFLLFLIVFFCHIHHLRIIISAVEEVVACFRIVEIAAVADGVHGCDFVGEVGGGFNQIALCIVGISADDGACKVGDGGNVALNVLDEEVGGVVIIESVSRALGIKHKGDAVVARFLRYKLVAVIEIFSCCAVDGFGNAVAGHIAFVGIRVAAIRVLCQRSVLTTAEDERGGC